MSKPDDPWLTVQEIAARWGLAQNTVRKRIKQGKLHGVVVAGGGESRKHYRVRASEVDRYEAENMT